MFTTGLHATGYHDTPYFVGTIDLAQIPPGTRWTYYTLIQEARELLQDEGPGWFRYSDQLLVNQLNRGLQELSRIRPDVFYDLFAGNSLQVPEITELSSAPPGTYKWTKVFHFELRFYPALVTYVVGMTMATEDPFFEGGWESGKVQAQIRLFRRHVLSA